MSEPGRPTKLTSEAHDKIVQALNLGNYRQDAAAFAGVGVATLRRWLVRGAQEQEGEYARLYEAVTESESRAKIMILGCVTRAARDGDWRAGAWYLQRKFPHQFSDRCQLFLIHKTFEQVEAAALAAGIQLPDSVWNTALTTLAGDLVQKLPSQLQLGLKQPSDLDDELADFDVTDDQRDALFEMLHAQKRKGVEVIKSSPS